MLKISMMMLLLLLRCLRLFHQQAACEHEGRSRTLKLFAELMVLLHRVDLAGGSVEFLCVPAHVGVEENEVADGAARTL